jgi:DNA-binding FadR family transcriptional regulator/bacterioferritin-associated ferredoxin
VIVCHCAAVNDRRIRELVADGADDLLAVAGACGAGSFCGGCAPVIASLLAQATGKPVATFMQAAPTPPDTAQPLLLRKRADTVAREVQEDIAAAGWAIGEPLGTEAGLAQRYAVTPPTMRQALRVLAHHDLVREDGGRFLVGAPSPATIGEAAAIHLHRVGVRLDEVVDTRRALETFMVQRAATNADDVTRARLRAGHLPEQHTDFHLLLAKAAGNPAFALLVDALVRLARDLAPAGGGATFRQRSRQTAAEHTEIAAAVSDGDAHLAAERMAAHIEAVYAAIPASAAAQPPEVATRRRAHERERPAVELARTIALDIRERDLQSGQLLGTERELVLRYGTTRDVFRQAVALLELYSVAYPRAGPGGGVIVGSDDKWAVATLMARYLDYARIEPGHIAEVRYALELRSAELASTHITPEDGERLERRLAEELTARERTPLRARGHHNIHPLIAELSGNRVLALFTSALILALLRRVPADVPEQDRAARHDAVASVHASIVEAISAGDGSLARQRMLRHLQEDSDFRIPDARAT